MAFVGYARVSTREGQQVVDRQIDALHATATVVQRGQVLARMIFRCDLPPDDPYFLTLVDRLLGTAAWFRDLLESDPSRTLIVEPVCHPRDPSPPLDAATCRGDLPVRLPQTRSRRRSLRLASVSPGNCR